MTTLSDFLKVDGVDYPLAEYFNFLFSSSLRAEMTNTETISATRELSDNDVSIQVITASGADRTVELAPEASTNHPTIIQNGGASNKVVVKDDSGASTYASLSPGEWVMFLSFGGIWKKFSVNQGYRLSVTVVSNNITVAVKTFAGDDPSPTDPVEFVIGGVRRVLTQALSVTKNAGTNWGAAGSAELATKEIDWFPYIIWNTGPATDILDIGFSRIPYASVFSEFSTTTTDQKYLAYGNATQPAGPDDVINIGRFAATLSAGAGFTWSIPTYTSANLKHTPTYDSRELDFFSTITLPAGNLSSIVRAEKYQVVGRNFIFDINDSFTINSAAPAYIQFSLPFTPGRAPNFSAVMTDTAIVSSNVTSSGNSLFVRDRNGAGFTVGAGRDARMRFSASLV